MAKYLLLKHYRGAPTPVNDVPMDQWAPDEVDAHMRFMDDFGKRLEANGEYVDAQALSPEGAFVRANDDAAERGRGAGPAAGGASARLSTPVNRNAMRCREPLPDSVPRVHAATMGRTD